MKSSQTFDKSDGEGGGWYSIFAKRTNYFRKASDWGPKGVHSWEIRRYKQLLLKNPFWFGHSNPPNLEVFYSEQVPPALRGVWKGSIPMLSFEKFQTRSNEHKIYA